MSKSVSNAFIILTHTSEYNEMGIWEIWGSHDGENDYVLLECDVMWS
jgi:hypothetical protein